MNVINNLINDFLVLSENQHYLTINICIRELAVFAAISRIDHAVCFWKTLCVLCLVLCKGFGFVIGAGLVHFYFGFFLFGCWSGTTSFVFNFKNSFLPRMYAHGAGFSWYAN